MASSLPKFTYRTDQVTLDKLRYVADNNFRTLNREIDMLVKDHIAHYEAEHGEIRLPEKDN